MEDFLEKDGKKILEQAGLDPKVSLGFQRACVRDAVKRCMDSTAPKNSQ